jgi:hypothetical protein
MDMVKFKATLSIGLKFCGLTFIKTKLISMKGIFCSVHLWDCFQNKLSKYFLSSGSKLRENLGSSLGFGKIITFNIFQYSKKPEA